MLTKLTSFVTIGIGSEPVTVEVGSSFGEAMITIVGLGDTAVQESKQRVRMALRSSGFRLPTGRTITVNLAPAHLKKVGPRYDLPIALGLLLISDLFDVPANELEKMGFVGELALDGTLRHVSGVLSAAIACRRLGLETLVVPAIDAPEAMLVPGLNVIGAENLMEVLAILGGGKSATVFAPPLPEKLNETGIDFSDIRGQDTAKRALEIAAAGGHNVLLSGAPGSGKTLLARALQSILPPLSREESLEVTQIYSVASLLPPGQPLLAARPFRMVHHTASGVSIVGGGQIPGPGEVSLAHRGVLFLDEIAEFPATVLEVLRQPLEDRRITITRAQGSVTFPADVLLVAAMNPPELNPATARSRARRISQPLLDRIDLRVDVEPVPIDDLQKAAASPVTSSFIRERVIAAREKQRARFQGTTFSTNKEMNVRDLSKFCPLDEESEKLLKQAAERLKLSARSYHRTIKVARTIADLANAEVISAPHIAEALQYRQGRAAD